MNYRHAFHAGNFADVFKHVLVSRILLYLMRKDAPVRFIDTHAGRGRYELAGPEAGRTGEWRGGIGRLLDHEIPLPVSDLLAPWLEVVRSEGAPTFYPGSPLLAQCLLRPADRLLLAELHPEEAQALARTTGRDPRVRIVERDGYEALKAAVPPPERRGLVLVDPPFETADEWARMDRALVAACRKWPTGIYALWYPIKDPAAGDAFAARVAATGIPRLLRLELLLEARPKPGRRDALALIGCGLLVVNPPFPFADEAAAILAFLADRLAPEGRGTFRLEWLAREPARSP